ncbi:ArsR/SmtB family transcription factor [Roseivivax sp. CAU 1753]
MDAIFKALNDPARRKLLDALRLKDGQTLTELEEQLDQSRFGVMKHLKVLEDAHLIVTRRRGRFKDHYLNVLPLQEMVDRWVHPFLTDQARGLSSLKTRLESRAMAEKPDFVMSTFIDCTHDALWDALTRGASIAEYHFACSDVTGDYTAPGDTVVCRFPNGDPLLTNRVLSIDPKTRIELEFAPSWGGDDTPSRCIYLLEPQSSGMKLTVEHFDIPASQTGIADGWARLFSGLKTYVETGKGHRFAPERAS